MTCDPPHGFAKQAETRWNSVPRGSARGMGKRNQIERAMLGKDPERTPHHFVELLKGKELGDGKFAYGNEQSRLKKSDLIVHPARAIPDLIGSGDPVATGGGFARKATAHCTKINRGAHLFLRHPAELLEPAEESSACSPREGFPEHRFLYAGRLADEHDFAEDSASGNRRWQHSGTAAALAQKRDVLIQLFLFARGARHLPRGPIYRRKNERIKVSTTLTMMQVTMGK